MSHNIVYQLKRGEIVKEEGSLRDCWKTLTDEYIHCTVLDLIDREIRIERKS